MVEPDQELTMRFDQAEASKLLAAAGDQGKRDRGPAELRWPSSTPTATAPPPPALPGPTIPAALPIQIMRAERVPANKVEAFFKNPFANFEAAPIRPAQN